MTDSLKREGARDNGSRLLHTLLTIGLTILVTTLAFFFTDRLAFGERTAEDRGAMTAKLASLEKQNEHKADLKDIAAIHAQLTRIEEEIRALRSDIRQLERRRAARPDPLRGGGQ